MRMTPCSQKGEEVLIQLGDGKVDFAGVFKKRKSSGFSGPLMVEGATAGQTSLINARKNREFPERVLASVWPQLKWISKPFSRF
jgi:hypothetical protein